MSFTKSLHKLVQSNGHCNLLCATFGLLLHDLTFLNQYINHNCTNFYAQESYCVAPVGELSDYPGHSGYMSNGVVSSVLTAP